jgi:hypothetical protein
MAVVHRAGVLHSRRRAIVLDVIVVALLFEVVVVNAI